MKLLRNHQGLGLATVLGIVALILASISTLFIVSVRQARIMEANLRYSEDYLNAMERVDAAQHIIARDQNTDPTYLADLSTYLGVTITSYSPSIWQISHPVTTSKWIVSYLTDSAVDFSTYGLFLSKTGSELGFTLSPMVTTASLLAAYMTEFTETTFGFTPNTTFTDFQSVVTYVLYLVNNVPNTYVSRTPTQLTSQTNPTANGHWYITGNVTIPVGKNLTVPAGRILFINGSLTMNRNSILTGNVVVRGNVLLVRSGSSTETVRGTLYVSGNFTADRRSVYGISTRPSFIFAQNNVTLGSVSATGYAYFLSTNFYGGNSGVVLTGGVYATGTRTIPLAGISANPNLNTSLFFTQGVPTELLSDGTSNFLFTQPRLE